MKILFKDIRKNIVKVQIENLDDLWYTSYIIDSGDFISSKTFRKIKLGDGTDRNIKVIKKEVFLSISVEKIEFHKYSDILRVSGKVTMGPENIPLGSYHTINLEIGSIFKIEKLNFLKYQIEKLDEASKESDSKILVCVHDREECIFAILKKYGYEILFGLSGDVSKKTDFNVTSKDFFAEIAKNISELDKRYNLTNIIIASPAFWKEYVLKKVRDDNLKKKIVVATCNSVGENGINEVMHRPEIKEVLKQERFAKETMIVESLLAEISKQGKAEYGVKKSKELVDAGAASELIITDGFIQKRRREDNFLEIEKLMKKVDNMDGKIHLISSEHEGGKKLDGLGGIAVILRYKLNY